jgi:hypothetical protein
MAGYHVNTSADGHHWRAIDTAPSATAIIGDGKRIFIGTQGVNGGQAFSATSETSPGTFTTISSPPVARPTWFALDPDHHVLYASAWEGGLYRMVTE